MACTRSGPTASRSSSRRSHRPRPSQVRKTWRGRAAPPPRPLGCIDIPPAHHLEPVETTTISPSPPPAVAPALAALPIYYGIDDLTHGYQAGFVAGHAVIHHDLSKLGFNFAEGLSNGAIWALIAIGYTLVYGIIEL